MMSKKKNRNKKKKRVRINRFVKKISRLLDRNDDFVNRKITNYGIKEKFEQMNKNLELDNYIQRRLDEEKRQMKMRKKYNLNMPMIKKQKAQSLHGYTDSYGTLLKKTKSKINHSDLCRCKICRGNKEIEITDPRLKMFMALRDSFDLAVNETLFLDKLQKSDKIYEAFLGKKISSNDLENMIKEIEDDTPKSIEDKSPTDLIHDYQSKKSNVFDLNYYRTKW